MEPAFLSLAEVLRIHDDQIERYGGDTGIRDMQLLMSALGQPSATFGGMCLHQTPHEMAAAYCFHLVKNHPFVDGNKRVGAVAAIAFLALNGCAFSAPPGRLTEMIMSLARGKIDKADVTLFMREWTTEPKA